MRGGGSRVKTSILLGLLVGAVALGCGASGQLGEEWTWKRPCGTDQQLRADRQACLGEAAGLADPSSRVEYAQDLFGECIEGRGWLLVPLSTNLACQ